MFISTRFQCSLSLLLFSIIYVKCQNRCCGPRQWSANIVQKHGQYNRPEDSASVAETTTMYSYDYATRKEAYIQVVTNLTYHRTDTIKTIKDYTKTKQWVINGTQCSLRELNGDMKSPCISDSAAHIGNYRSTGPKVDVWLLKENGSIIRSTVTSSTCLPVMESLLSDGPVYTLTVSIYENVTQGISDRAIFNVPSFCPQSQINRNSRLDVKTFTETLYFRSGMP